MRPDELAPEVAALIRDRIQSYEALRALLLLHAEGSARSAEELSAELNLSGSSMASALESLARQQLLEATGASGSRAQYRYASGAHDATVGALVQAYSQQPIAVIRLLAASSIGRIRADALRAFADAFVLRKAK
jgi:predicted ArsR family transcriptional regulator